VGGEGAYARGAPATGSASAGRSLSSGYASGCCGWGRLSPGFSDLGIPILSLGGCEDIDRDFIERSDCFNKVVRIALAEDQVLGYDLPPQVGKEPTRGHRSSSLATESWSRLSWMLWIKTCSENSIERRSASSGTCPHIGKGCPGSRRASEPLSASGPIRIRANQGGGIFPGEAGLSV
jgi:hypothetical protein